ncbi:hypothetical protein [Paracnuella aquatica]|uniref:hypothetical protein n=1 Tax=Paracnuella aquatica TaxID=2268757 RepID=UPI0012D780E9|nr:hypothetical protein [Paracnuella aquatica]
MKVAENGGVNSHPVFYQNEQCGAKLVQYGKGPVEMCPKVFEMEFPVERNIF